LTQILAAKELPLTNETVLSLRPASSVTIMSKTEIKYADMERKILDAKKSLEDVSKAATYKSLEEELRRLELETMEKTKMKEENDKKEVFFRATIDATKERKKVIQGF
jgi:uncharacterized membrane protein YfbV (UPF0208 family)